MKFDLVCWSIEVPEEMPDKLLRIRDRPYGLGLGGSQLDIKELFNIQRDFDRRMGWNRYERCETPEDVLDFMQHFVLVMVEELGEFSRVRKRFLRDRQVFDTDALKHELIDIFVYLMQACMALNMNLEEEYKKKMKNNEQRFFEKGQP